MKSVVLYSILAINVVMYIAVLVVGGDPINPETNVLRYLGGNDVYTLNGEPWRLISSMFLHAGLLHLAMNMYCLYQVKGLEEFFGRLGFASLYLVSGLMGGIASLLFTNAYVSIGASGAVFGLFGALLVVLYQRRHYIGADAAKSQVFSLLQFLALNLVIGFVVPGIDQAAHVGGLLGGAACAWFMRPEQDLSAKRRLAAVTGVGLGATALALVLMG